MNKCRVSSIKPGVLSGVAVHLALLHSPLCTGSIQHYFNQCGINNAADQLKYSSIGC